MNRGAVRELHEESLEEFDFHIQSRTRCHHRFTRWRPTVRRSIRSSVVVTTPEAPQPLFRARATARSRRVKAVDPYGDGLEPVFDAVPEPIVERNTQFVTSQGSQLATSVSETLCVGNVAFLGESVLDGLPRTQRFPMCERERCSCERRRVAMVSRWCRHSGAELIRGESSATIRFLSPSSPASAYYRLSQWASARIHRSTVPARANPPLAKSSTGDR